MFFFVNANIIALQHVAGVKLSLLPKNDSENPLSNGKLQVTWTTVHGELQFKKFFDRTIEGRQGESVTGENAVFVGTGRVVLKLNFRKFSEWNQLFQRQVVLPHLSGCLRQRGNRFGSLAAGVGRVVALTFVKKFLVPAVKLIRRELLNQKSPEIVEVTAKRKTSK